MQQQDSNRTILVAKLRSTPAKDLDADIYNEAFDNDALTYDSFLPRVSYFH